LTEEKGQFPGHPTDSLHPAGGIDSVGMNCKAVAQPGDYYFQAYFNSRGPAGVFHRMRLDRLMRHVPPHSSVLDLGCGSGVLLYLLKRQGCTVAGVDVRPQCVEFTRRVCGEGDFRCGDIREADMGRTFDVVLCTEVMEHFDSASQAQILDRIRTHTRHGGRAVITFPSRLYLTLEPLWLTMRKIISHGMTFDDESVHERIKRREVEEGLARRGFQLLSSSLYCMGAINIVIARRDGEKK